MNRFTRLASLLSLTAFVAGSLISLPSLASAKTVIVHAHAAKTKSGKVVVVKSYKRTVKPVKLIKIHGYTKVTKTGKIIKVKGYTRKPSVKSKMSKMKM